MKNSNKLLRILEVQEFGLNGVYMLFEISQVVNLINNHLLRSALPPEVFSSSILLSSAVE